ncbi:MULTISPECIES: hypothetical protein [Cupriavidus]|jgi:hypothetical protein|uniref:Uncharacterized protein n=1 Tax=Cupriavidus pauculus TaxID=82633 RepID=A0A5P2HHD6_9BURK|nr:hypothetical protein [Cupriavidus pauculus]QET06510.1 hypothetical protein FOB72_32010 [Cupriavidus pauculus]
MYNSLTPDTIRTLEQMVQLIDENPKDARIAHGIAQLKASASAIVDASLAEPAAHARNAARVVADGLMAAAAVCERLRGD